MFPSIAIFFGFFLKDVLNLFDDLVDSIMRAGRGLAFVARELKKTFKKIVLVNKCDNGRRLRRSWEQDKNENKELTLLTFCAASLPTKPLIQFPAELKIILKFPPLS